MNIARGKIQGENVEQWAANEFSPYEKKAAANTPKKSEGG